MLEKFRDVKRPHKTHALLVFEHSFRNHWLKIGSFGSIAALKYLSSLQMVVPTLAGMQGVHFRCQIRRLCNREAQLKEIYILL